MSTKVTVFNPNKHPVTYSVEGFMLGGLEAVEVDPTDPACALALEQGHLSVVSVEVVDVVEDSVEVLAPQDQAEVSNSEVVATDPVAEQVAEAESDEEKPTTRKKSATQQAPKE